MSSIGAVASVRMDLGPILVGLTVGGTLIPPGLMSSPLVLGGHQPNYISA